MISEFDDVKVGDELALFCFGNFKKKVRVHRATKTQIICDDNSKYSKKDGYQIGYSGYGHPHLVKITQFLSDEIRQKDLSKSLANIDWTKIPLNKLEAIQSIVEHQWQ